MQKPKLSEHDGIVVVRDDLIRGGTKVRAIPVLFNGAAEYVYASPVFGYAQIALAVAAASCGKKATVFCAARSHRHARTSAASAAGAKVVEVPFGRMSVVKARAREYCAQTGAQLLPFGMDSAAFIAELSGVAAGVAYSPKEVWCVAGSGVLSRALQLAWPAAKHFAVRIGCEPSAGQAEVLEAPETFDEDAAEPPPFPSCSNYDAKAWRFIKQKAAPGALFWNVAA